LTVREDIALIYLMVTSQSLPGCTQKEHKKIPVIITGSRPEFKLDNSKTVKTGENCIMKSFALCTLHPDVMMMKSSTARRVEYTARMGDMRMHTDCGRKTSTEETTWGGGGGSGG
jgi:hypothetical protein